MAPPYSCSGNRSKAGKVPRIALSFSSPNRLICALHFPPFQDAFAMASSAPNTPSAAAEKPPRPKGLALLRVALSTRKAGCMLGFGFSSGLPFALLIGTLNAWLGEVGIKLATIGVLSWIGLSYSFKFLWAPLVDRVKLPVLETLGRRRSWILLCQVVLAIAIAGLAVTDPTTAIGTFALIAFVAAFASATQDIALDAWRIEAR
jgi:PAT family beta-lactamase induction signal transducer AmpG